MLFRAPTIFRFVLIIAASFLLAYVLPMTRVPLDSSGSLDNMMWIFSLLIGFLINRALERKQAIQTTVSVELSRLRRMQHLAEQMRPAARGTKIVAAIRAYQSAVGREFASQVATQDPFRSVTHLVYEFKPKTGQEELFLADLLESTRDIALERQRRIAAMDTGISWYSFLIMSAYVSFMVVLLFLNRETTGFSPFGVGGTVAALLLVMDLLFRLNHFSKAEEVHVQGLYRRNTTH